jgi:hypothetical protein
MIKTPVRVQTTKEYGGDVQQMNSPYKEAGYWLDRFDVIDAKSRQLARCENEIDAQHIVMVINDHETLTAQVAELKGEVSRLKARLAEEK